MKQLTIVKRVMGSLLILSAAALLVNCVDVEMETAVNADRSGKGKLVYSWDPSQNLDYLDIDGSFSMIANNPTVKVTGEREYDAEGVRYREIEWIFKDINEVDLEGLTYSLKEEKGNLVLRAIFQRQEPVQEPVGSHIPGHPMDPPSALLEGGTPSDTVRPESTRQPLTAQDSAQRSPTGPGGQGLDPQTQREMDAETQRQMEEMLGAMIRAAVQGHGVTFRFLVPLEVLEAPGGSIDGKKVTWSIPLIQLIEPTSDVKFDEFKMVMKAP